MVTTIKGVKDMGWGVIKISRKGFDGAVKEYTNAEGSKVAVAFGTNGAFLMADAQGLYSADEVVGSAINNKNIDVNEPQEIAEAVMVVTAYAGETSPVQEVVDQYGLGEHVADIEERAKVLNLLVDFDIAE